jgi:general secretion pathway protein I
MAKAFITKRPPSVFRRSQLGMTLIEVMVALAIFATASLAVIQAVTQHINSLSYLEEKTIASMVLDNQMAAIYLQATPNLSQKGKVSMAHREWYWQVTPVETSNDMLKAMDVSVSLNVDHSSPLVTVRSYVTP